MLRFCFVVQSQASRASEMRPAPSKVLTPVVVLTATESTALYIVKLAFTNGDILAEDEIEEFPLARRVVSQDRVAALARAFGPAVIEEQRLAFDAQGHRDAAGAVGLGALVSEEIGRAHV